MRKRKWNASQVHSSWHRLSEADLNRSDAILISQGWLDGWISDEIRLKVLRDLKSKKECHRV